MILLAGNGRPMPDLLRAPPGAIVVGLAVCVTAASCGSSSPTAPGPTGTNVLAGQLVATVSGTAIAGATIAIRTGQLYGASNFQAQQTTDASGRFSFAGVPADTLLLTVNGPGLIPRQTLLSVTGSTSSLVLDAIRDVPPFSLAFYRQFARNGYDSQTLAATKPWTVAPSFYVQTVMRDTGTPIPEAVLAGIRRVAFNSVAELSASRFFISTYETGTNSRDQQLGWINIVFVQALPKIAERDSGDGPTLGESLVGGPIGMIQLVYDPAIDAANLYNPERCESATVEAFDHEIVHAMGFWHTATTFDDFQSGIGCPGTGRSGNTRFHAAVMYSRPFGNIDQDQDLSPFYSLLASRR